MYWKYHLESGDHVSFEYEGRIVNGTVRGWLNPEDYEDMSFDDVEPSDFDLLIKSGTKEVEVNLADITSSVKKKDRKTDLPYMSEEFRLSGGI